jgi:hypothetical protein
MFHNNKNLELSIFKKSIGNLLTYLYSSTSLLFLKLITTVCPSDDYSQPHSDKCGSVLRRLAFALASIFLWSVSCQLFWQKRLSLTSKASLRVETLTWPGTLVLLV